MFRKGKQRTQNNCIKSSNNVQTAVSELQYNDSYSLNKTNTVNLF